MVKERKETENKESEMKTNLAGNKVHKVLEQTRWDLQDNVQ